jgi:hypothetical protein
MRIEKLKYNYLELTTIRTNFRILVGTQIFCMNCKKTLDCEDTVSAQIKVNNKPVVEIMACGNCYDQRYKPSMETFPHRLVDGFPPVGEVVDGRELYKPKALKEALQKG